MMDTPHILQGGVFPVAMQHINHHDDLVK